MLTVSFSAIPRRLPLDTGGLYRHLSHFLGAQPETKPLSLPKVGGEGLPETKGRSKIIRRFFLTSPAQEPCVPISLFLKGAPGQLPSTHLQNRSGPPFSSFAGAATPARHDDSQPIGIFPPNNHGPPTTPSSGFPPPPCHHQSIEKRTSLCPTNHPINRPLSPHSLPVRMRPARRPRFGAASNPAKALVTPILRVYV